jgi:hypothetical protein
LVAGATNSFVPPSSRVFVIGCLVAASPARADNFQFHGTASGSVATTDNESGTAENKRGSVFSDVRPGMLFTYNSPRHIHELLTEVDFIYNIRADRPNVTFRGGYKAFFVTGPRSELSMDADASMGEVNALQVSQPVAGTPTQVIPSGRTDTKQFAANENGSYQAAKGTRVFQRIFGRYTGTESGELMATVTTKAVETGAGIGWDYRRKTQGFQAELGGTYVHLDKLDPAGVQMGSRIDNQLNPRGVLVYQLDISQRWSLNLDGGVEYVHPVTKLFGKDLRDPYNPGEERKSALFPIFGGVVAYTDVWGRAQLAARRAVTPNLYIAQNTISDSANLTFAMPLKFLDKDSQKRAPKVVGIGTAGVERMQLIDPFAGELRGEFKVARLDFALAWSPHEGQTYGLRYEVTYQNGDTVGEMVVPSYLRNTFYFTFALRYPTEQKVKVPRRANQSVRADKGDLSPIGAEPVVIDPAELLEGSGGN